MLDVWIMLTLAHHVATSSLLIIRALTGLTINLGHVGLNRN